MGVEYYAPGERAKKADVIESSAVSCATTSAMVLAAGLGARLRPLSDWRAKPAIPVGDAPVMVHVLRALRAGGVHRIACNTHYREADVRALADAEGVFVSHEETLLGTAGGVAGARSFLGNGPVVIYNADIVAPRLDLAGLTLALRGEAVLAVRLGPKDSGNVGTDPHGRIVRLRKQSFGAEVRGGEFLGIHLLGAGLALPHVGCLVGDVYLPALARGADLFAFPVDTPFFDVGSLEGYAAANDAWLTERGVGAWVADDAVVSAEVELRRSLVGARARVTGAGALVRCVVWPDAHAVAPLSDAAVTPYGTIALR